MTYSVDFRRQVLAIREQEKLTLEETAKRFGVGIASLTRWRNRIEPNQSVPRKRKLDLEALRLDVKTYPDDYQYERAKRFGVCPKAIWQALRKIGVSYKKNLAASKSERRRTAVLPKADKRL